MISEYMSDLRRSYSSSPLLVNREIAAHLHINFIGSEITTKLSTRFKASTSVLNHREIGLGKEFTQKRSSFEKVHEDKGCFQTDQSFNNLLEASQQTLASLMYIPPFPGICCLQRDEASVPKFAKAVRATRIGKFFLTAYIKLITIMQRSTAGQLILFRRVACMKSF